MFINRISIDIESSYFHQSSFADKLKIRKFRPILDESEDIMSDFILTPKENISDTRIIKHEDVAEKIMIELTTDRKKFQSLKTDRNDLHISKSRSSRSTKRLLRTFNKSCSVEQSQSTSEFDCNTIIFNSSNKKQIKQFTNSSWIRCKICKKRIHSKEEKIRAHYRIVHNFLFMKTSDSDIILTRLKVNKKYFHFCCLSCRKKFIDFDHFIQHRCKYIQRKAFADDKNDLEIKVRSSMPDFEIDYKCEREFFKNLGLQRRLECQTKFKCDHVNNEKIDNPDPCYENNFMNSSSRCHSLKKFIRPLSSITKIEI
ncbi:uncharacterized protein LOC113789211 [Dermatophagoides pteronyssinus]|uniref:uncharacterized protein LOC113789211 n=1 Tax=Dermatophagoides pteronyssinus TaxID=6956 RepID=UPI003F674D49